MTDFNGESLILTLDEPVNGVLNINWQSVYSEWKDWQLGSGRLNKKYPAAFRPDGGGQLTSIIDQGRYYFFANDVGWRVKPFEADGTIYALGNLAVENTELPALVSTDGAFTVLIAGLQPVTQGVTSVMGDQLAYGSFNGGVWVNEDSELSGTGNTIKGDPIGNAANPVNNVIDAVNIRTDIGLPKTIYFIENYTLSTNDDVSGFQLIGQNPARTLITINEDSNTLNTAIKQASISGFLDNNTIISESAVKDLTYFSGEIRDSQILTKITLGNAAQANIVNCSSGVAGQTTPEIDFGGSGQSLVLSGYRQGIKFTNKTGPESVSVSLDGGQVRIDLTTVTNGHIVVRGVGRVVDDATGNWLPHGTYGDLILDNETTYGVMLQELWTANGLDLDVDPTEGTVIKNTLDAVNFIKGVEGGSWELVSNQMIFRDESGVELTRFNMFDQSGLPTTTGDIYKRVKV